MSNEKNNGFTINSAKEFLNTLPLGHAGNPLPLAGSNPAPGTYVRTATDIERNAGYYTVDFDFAPGDKVPVKTPVHSHNVTCVSALRQGQVVEVGFRVTKENSVIPVHYNLRKAGDINVRVADKNNVRGDDAKNRDAHAIVSFSKLPVKLTHQYPLRDTTVAEADLGKDTNKRCFEIDKRYAPFYEQLAKDADEGWTVVTERSKHVARKNVDFKRGYNPESGSYKNGDFKNPLYAAGRTR